ncbi:unnamed protein product [Thelazia callipaeda]|uniref:Ion_trans_2 domain-containing protein n=1 Tax=Thelazia callipaeda TaxID=103827 RepID=A0A0N5D3R2_THECL|nr:unnamed protein product [Thelazia callipaeda]
MCANSPSKKDEVCIGASITERLNLLYQIPEDNSTNSNAIANISKDISNENSLLRDSNTQFSAVPQRFSIKSYDPPSRKLSRFEIQPVQINFDCNDEANDRNSLLYNDYFQKDEDDELFTPYDLLMHLQFPMKKSHASSQLEKFKDYWENYSFYAIWRKKFIQDHSCQEQDVWKELFVESIPHLLINLFLTFYVVGGAAIFQIIDKSIAEEKFYNVVQFTFTTIATVGYGNIVPTTDASKLFCMFYTLVGVPLLFLSLTNIGQFIAEGYWIFLASLSRTHLRLFLQVIMSTFLAALYNYLRRLHYLGRNFTGAAHVEVWFGGTRMSVSELLYIVAEEFNVSPKMLYKVLHDLDDIITKATDPKVKLTIERVRNLRNQDSCSSSSEIRECVDEGVCMVEVKDSTKMKQKHVSSNFSLTYLNSYLFYQLKVKEEQLYFKQIMQALAMFHHVVKTKSNLTNAKRRSSSASAKLHASKVQSQSTTSQN